MATYVLIPGAFHGRWCWEKIVPLLEAAGHRVVAPELLGMGEDDTPTNEVSVKIWADQIADLLKSEAEPVTLVGHSRGGAVISEVAERVPDRIERLVYLCAFLLKDGQSPLDLAGTAENAGAIASALIHHEDGTVTLSKEAIGALFYNDTPEDLLEIARQRVGPEPLSVLGAPIHVTEERFGSVPRVYIETSNDRSIPIALQRAMQAALPCSLTILIETDHSPFFSAPSELASALESVLGTRG